ncbi:putative pectinesterase/pectinesterase inhibitor 7 [Camellia lanceoleosa]|uniref:Pectinesterase/pectinesterase inhibitor 7 n=1 Tax=Camellia lanceoleosa TaxID=1840588 RepID=A0ACC0II51_9ERIC|nr:putative pectinesterase/pectinesterase inhibitor 7 [Camellia lanceoleosa]
MLKSIPASGLLRKLRWSTLGLQFDWSKNYNVSLPHNKIPNALCQLAKKMAAPAMPGGKEFRPEAAIVNYFGLDVCQVSCIWNHQAEKNSWTRLLGGSLASKCKLLVKIVLMSCCTELLCPLFSVSLALFKYGYVPKTRKGRWLAERESMFSRNGHLGLKMSSQHRKVYESVSGRKLLQTSGGGQVKVNIMVIVNKDGSGNFTTISDAVAAAPNNTAANTGYFMIYVVGVYEEYVSIAKNKQYLMIVGDGINKTIITGNHSVADGWTTYSSATVAVVGPRFVAINITIRNTAGAIKQQAVALRNDADLSTFYKCSFEGYQDTLYTHSLRQFYRECDIYGTVDFIFGNAAVVFQNCNVYPRLPILGQFNTITAQGRTDINQNTGTSIQNCTITAAPDLAANNGTTQTYLGRPWKLYSRTVYIQSFLDSLINPAGWAMWSGTFALDTLYYAEYNNRGPGSSTANRVNWPGYHVINATDAVNFTVSNFISGNSWLPTTGVPYTGGLM